MKILIVSQYFNPEGFLINSLSSELVKKGHQVTVITGLPNYPQGQFFNGYSFLSGPWTEKFQGVQVIRTPLISRGTSRLQLMLNYISFVILAPLFAMFRLPKGIDVIFCFGLSPVTSCLPAIFFKKIIGKKLVYWVQDLWPESVSAVGASKNTLFLKAIEKIVIYVYKNCDLILTQSKAFSDGIQKRNLTNTPLSYVPNWADPFPEVLEPEWVKELKGKFKIGFAGNIGKAQDMKTILAAAQLLQERIEIQFVIAGDGSDKKWLDEEIKQRNLKNILTVGRKPYSEMKPFFEKCQVLLVSLTDEFIFSLTVPSKVQAYMSAGRPLLVSVRGEGARIVREAQCGLCCDPENPQSLSETILKMYNSDLNQMQQWSENGKKYFNQNFQQEIVIGQIEKHLMEYSE